jgi:ParB family chromosome partitioning protein
MALASQIAAESVPEEHTVTANEQAPAVVARGILAGSAPSPEAGPDGAAATATAVAPPDAPVTGSAADWAPERTAEQATEPSRGGDVGEEQGRGSAAAPAIVPGAASASTSAATPMATPAARPAATPERRTDAGGARLSAMPIAEIRPSPFQPKGRPSHDAVAAVARAIERMGSIEVLVAAEGHTTFQALSAEAKRLAELAYSVSREGVRDPVEVRQAEDGAIEALSGHRRIAAAKLVGLTDVPVLHRGPMSAVQAAATVLSGNLHREDFTPWQEAVLVTEVIAQRRADGLPADVRTIGAIMGYSHGRVSTLQTIRRVLSDEFLRRLGDLAAVEEALARFGNYSRLEEVARMPDDARRESVLRRLLGLPDPTPLAAEPEAARVFDHRPKRRGGFTIEVHRSIEELAAGDAAALRELLATQLARLDARLRTLGRDLPA